jgi:glutathione synthase/RimK-type ligase-like ATP-grasp enzyme
MPDPTSADRVIALVTYAAQPALSADDQLLAIALEARGARAIPVVWSAPDTDWARFAAIIVRSSWDYFLRPAEFLGWVDHLEAVGARVFNEPRTLRWNADKTYLRDLEARGVPVIPTRWIDAGAPASLREIRLGTGWSELVVKPTISGGAHQTWRASPGDEATDDARLGAMAANTAVMVQPLVDVVADDGEWSLVFVDGAFSHAVLKRPRSGDFRVQIEHGGSFEPVTPTPHVIEQAETAIRAAPTSGMPPLYARVDGCIVNGELLLMELELLEPALFLGTSAGAADRLADAVLARLR